MKQSQISFLTLAIISFIIIGNGTQLWGNLRCTRTETMLNRALQHSVQSSLLRKLQVHRWLLRAYKT